MKRNFNIQSKPVLLWSLCLLGGVLSACAPKQNLGTDLTKTQVFQTEGIPNQTPSSSTSSSSSSQEPKRTGNSSFSMPSNNMCSTSDSNSAGTNIVQAKSGVVVRVFKDTDSAESNTSNSSPTAMIYAIKPFGQPGTNLGPEVQLPPQDAIANRKALINKKQISVNLSGIDPGKYFALIMDTIKKTSLSSLIKFEVKPDGSVVISNTQLPIPGSSSSGKTPWTVLYNFNPDQPPKSFASEGNGEPTNEPTPEQCDEKASPLMMDTAHDLKEARFDMSAPLDGIKFDIDGNGKKRQISWPANPNYNAFLVLPNQSGQVNSIHELFGNNTRGPDGHLAQNGFEALRKYDLNHDQKIDKRDAIYDQLRLWYDLNRNGQADPGELKDLLEKNILSISLNYQEVSEEDLYKNETRQRSEVESANDKKHMIIDLWFRKVF